MKLDFAPPRFARTALRHCALVTAALPSTRSLFHCGALLALFATLAGCGGGGGGDIGIAQGNQSPDPVTVEYPIAYVQRPLPADSTLCE